MLTYKIQNLTDNSSNSFKFKDKIKINIENKSNESVKQFKIVKLNLVKEGGILWNSKYPQLGNKELAMTSNGDYELEWEVPSTLELPKGQFRFDFFVLLQLNDDEGFKYNRLTTQPVSIHEDCVFCNSAFEGKVEYEDSEVSIIEDRSPASDTLHLLIIPKEHIQNCNSLSKEHLPLLNIMKTKSEEFIRSKGEFEEHETIVGFHQPPFIMVNHLHLHVIILPLRSWFHYILFNNFSFVLTKLSDLIDSLNKQ